MEAIKSRDELSTRATNPDTVSQDVLSSNRSGNNGTVINKSEDEEETQSAHSNTKKKSDEWPTKRCKLTDFFCTKMQDEKKDQLACEWDDLEGKHQQ